MAGVIKRTMDLFRSKANKALDAAEDPRDTLDLGYKQMQDQVVELRRALADVATQRKRLELEAEKQQAQAAKLQDQAKAALDQGNEDLAREALTRRAAIAQHLSELESQHATVVEQEQRVAKSVEAIEAKVQAMRAEKELLKSSYTAAEAEAKAGELVSGISKSMGDSGAAIERAREKIDTMQARAGAVNELLDAGSLPDITGTGGDDIQAQLDKVKLSADVDAQLAALKAGKTDALESGEQA